MWLLRDWGDLRKKSYRLPVCPKRDQNIQVCCIKQVRFRAKWKARARGKWLNSFAFLSNGKMQGLNCVKAQSLGDRILESRYSKCASLQPNQFGYCGTTSYRFLSTSWLSKSWWDEAKHEWGSKVVIVGGGQRQIWIPGCPHSLLFCLQGVFLIADPADSSDKAHQQTLGGRLPWDSL